MAEAATAGTEPVKDIVVPASAPANAPPPANDNGDKPESPKEGAAAAPVPEQPKVDPEKLARAREVARQRAAEAARRMAAQRDAERREAERVAALQAVQQERARSEALARQLETLRDPKAALDYLEKIGLPAKTLAQRAVEQSTPEAKLKADLEARVEERVGAVQKQYEAQLQQMREEREAAQRAETMRQATTRFIGEASNTEVYPAVAKVVGLGPNWRDSIVAEARQILQDAYRKTGYEYSNEEVLSYLEDKYSQLLTPKPQDAASKSKDESTSQEAPNGTGNQESASAGGSRTLTNRAAQVKGSLPPDFDSLSKEEQNAALAALYRALRRP